jgi:hypothetical protein
MNSIKKNHVPILMSACVVIVSTLACRPVLAIGWNEFFIVGVLFAVLLGPPLYRLMRRLEEFFKHKDKNP